MLRPDADERRIVGRILEYVSWSVPWQRQLWNVGSVAALHEVIESSEAVAESALSKPSLSALCGDVVRLIGPDPGVGTRDLRRRVNDLLRGPLRAHGAEWLELREAASLTADGYLSRWAAAMESPAERPGNEHAARLIVGHLKWLGFSGDALHRWLTYHSKYRDGTQTLADILRDADKDLASREPRQFEVLVPCISAPRIDVPGVAPTSWVNGPALAARLENAQDSGGVPHNGGFVLAVSALDAGSAALRAREVLDRWRSRVELATPGTLELTGPIWVDGKRSRHRATGARREVEVGALQREHLIYEELNEDATSLQLDDALQLARPLESGGVAAAIAGGWAAIESLLVGGDEEKVVAARRLAAVVACSYPRAELTTLAYLHQNEAGDALANELAQADTNLARARLAADAIQRDSLVAGTRSEDQAALARMRAVLAEPRDTLGRVRQYVEDAMFRLYRQRNLIVHGGRVSGQLRTATLEGAPALVGAGLDRIAHAWFVDRRTPLELAASAELGLAIVGSPSARGVTDLLEP